MNARIARFNVACLVDMRNGMAVNGGMPGDYHNWMKRFRELTVGPTRSNAVVMGRKTYEYLCARMQTSSLPDRQNYVISNIYNQSDHTDIIVYKDLGRCLTSIASNGKTKETWIIGGEQLFREALSRFLCYCDRIYICKIDKEDVHCDQFFPIEFLRGVSSVPDGNKTTTCSTVLYTPKVVHQELQYTQLLGLLVKENRVRYGGKDYNCSYNQSLSFRLEREFPVITTREIDVNTLISDFVDDMRNRTFSSDSLGFRLRTDQKFDGIKDYDGFDHLNDFVDTVRFSRGAVPYTLNLSRNNNSTRQKDGNNDVGVQIRPEIPWQFIPQYIVLNVPSNRSHLDMQVVCSEMEMMVTFPRVLTYCSILANVLGKITNLQPRYLTFHFSQAVIELDHVAIAAKQAAWDPKPFPTLVLKRAGDLILSDIERSDIVVSRYDSWCKIKHLS